MDEKRHFILFAKGKYGDYSRSCDWELKRCLKIIVGEVCGLEYSQFISESDIFTLLCSTCEDIGLNGFAVLKELVGSNSGTWVWNDIYKTLLQGLGMVKVKERQEDDTFKVLIEIGDVDQTLFDRLSPYVVGKELGFQFK